MRECVYIEDGSAGKYRCVSCGHKRRSDYPVEMLHRNCPAGHGLGDAVAALTSAVGIKPCGGCKKRQEKLNALGESARKLLHGEKS